MLDRKDSLFLVELNDSEILEFSEYYVLATDIGDVVDIVTRMLKREVGEEVCGVKSIKRLCRPEEIISRGEVI